MSDKGCQGVWPDRVLCTAACGAGATLIGCSERTARKVRDELLRLGEIPATVAKPGPERDAGATLIGCSERTARKVRDELKQLGKISVTALKPGRAALLHWVSDHWRSTPTAHDDAVRVAAHLRGQTRFVWKEGLVVQIMPAEEDKRLLKPTAKHALLPSAPR